MKKHLRKAKASLVIGFILVGTLFALVPSTSAKLLTYDSALEITYDDQAVKDAIFQPDAPPVSIPITIKFKVDIFEDILTKLYLRLLFLQTMIITSAQVKLEVINQPSWAAVSITPSSPYVEIWDTFKNTSAIVSIAPHDDAPAEGFSLKIKASIDPLLNNHVAAKEAYLDIIFQPGYSPKINTDVDSPYRIIGPQETTTFRIKITNMGNKETRVIARILDYPKGWTPLLASSEVTISSADSGGNNVDYVSFSITPPYGAGWHDDTGSISIELTPQFSPYVGNNSAYTGPPTIVMLTVRSRGFSTPGFEAVGVLLALVIVVTIILKKHRKT